MDANAIVGQYTRSRWTPGATRTKATRASPPVTSSAPERRDLNSRPWTPRAAWGSRRSRWTPGQSHHLLRSDRRRPQVRPAAIELAEPSPGLWPGSTRRGPPGAARAARPVVVRGRRPHVDLLASGLTGGQFRDLVPHAPTRLPGISAERAVPRPVAESGLFTIISRSPC